MKMVRQTKKEVLLTGFALSNPQHNFNSPIYGLDNWIYLANEGTYQSQFFEEFNDEGTEIHFPQRPQGPKLPKNANDRNVRVDLNNYRLEMLSGDSQYGHTFDPQGYHFNTTNWSHLYHEVLASRYVIRNQQLELPETMQYVPDYGIGFEIFPITQSPEHQLLTDVGSITSSCGITWYQGGLFPSPYENVVFIAEPTHNIVHSDLMYQDGATFGSKKQFENKEFLASSDSWFRPVQFYIGPDGAMYLIDFHRRIIEHPEWISEDMLNSGQLYQGVDQGRIYRITPNGTPNFSFSDLSLAGYTMDQLVENLQHDNIWWRRHSQRLLVDLQHPDTKKVITKFLESAKSIGAIHAIWTLEGIGLFDKQIIRSALQHDNPGVRVNAIKIAELHRDNFPGLEKILVSMKDDPDPKVRFQLLCTLGYFESSQSSEARSSLLFTDVEDSWVQLAALSATSVDAVSLLEQAVNTYESRVPQGQVTLIQNISKNIGRGGNTAEINRAIEITIKEEGEQSSQWRSASLLGLASTMPSNMETQVTGNNLKKLKALFSEKVNPELRSAGLKLLNAMGYFNQYHELVAKSERTMLDKEANAMLRVDAVRVMGWYDPDKAYELIQTLDFSQENPHIRMSIIKTLGLVSGSRTSEYLIGRWKELTPEERNEAVDILLANPDRQVTFLNALEANRLQASVLGWGRTVRTIKQPKSRGPRTS